MTTCKTCGQEVKPKICEDCGKEFIPKTKWHTLCIFCWATDQPKIHEAKPCVSCGEEFEPVLGWYINCPICYEEKEF